MISAGFRRAGLGPLNIKMIFNVPRGGELANSMTGNE